MNLTIHDLTEPQKRIYYTQMIYNGSCMYNIGGHVVIHGKINEKVLIKAICGFINAHDSFAIRLIEIDGVVKQYFTDDIISDVDIEFKDFSFYESPEEMF